MRDQKQLNNIIRKGVVDALTELGNPQHGDDLRTWLLKKEQATPADWGMTPPNAKYPEGRYRFTLSFTLVCNDLKKKGILFSPHRGYYSTDPDATVPEKPSKKVAKSAKKAPKKAISAPVEVEATPVEVDTTPVEVISAPVEAETPPVEADTTPEEAISAPVEVEATPVEADTTPEEVEATPVEVISAPVEADDEMLDDLFDDEPTVALNQIEGSPLYGALQDDTVLISDDESLKVVFDTEAPSDWVFANDKHKLILQKAKAEGLTQYGKIVVKVAEKTAEMGFHDGNSPLGCFGKGNAHGDFCYSRCPLGALCKTSRENL
jgi:hypothetical protein